MGISAHKRHSWLDSYKEYMVDTGVAEETARQYVARIDDILHAQWELGRNLVLLWSAREKEMWLLVVPHYLLVEHGEHEWVTSLVAGPKYVPLEELQKAAVQFNVDLKEVGIGFDPIKSLGTELVSALVRRYSVSLVHDRAVALFDAVGFSLLSPLEQVTQLNSLSYSVNAAYSKLLDKAIEITFARTTTGDGFYIWNRNTSIQGNIDLYHFVQLILADNAIARGKANSATTPHLRACFHMGSHYEFYQEEGLSPTTFSYIVGDVTIELARMIDKALPGQILIGDFNVPMQHPHTGEVVQSDTLSFMEHSLETLSDLDGVELSGDKIESIKCYLTGPQRDDGSFGTSRYRISDKHGLMHTVYNAKVNISRKAAEPIFLGIQEKEMERFDATDCQTLR
jgi:hypothetical protein